MITYTGSAMPVKTEAKETTLVVKNVINHVRTKRPRIIFKVPIWVAKASNTPKVVATPLPPLNFKNIVQL